MGSEVGKRRMMGWWIIILLSEWASIFHRAFSRGAATIDMPEGSFHPPPSLPPSVAQKPLAGRRLKTLGQKVAIFRHTAANFQRMRLGLWLLTVLTLPPKLPPKWGIFSPTFYIFEKKMATIVFRRVKIWRGGGGIAACFLPRRHVKR